MKQTCLLKVVLCEAVRYLVELRSRGHLIKAPELAFRGFVLCQTNQINAKAMDGKMAISKSTVSITPT